MGLVACGNFLDQGSNHDPCIDRQMLIHCTSREVLWLTFKLTLHSLSVGLGSSQFPHPKMSLKRSLWQQCENSSRAQLKKTRLVFGGLGSVEDGREVTEKKLCVKDMLCIRM